MENKDLMPVEGIEIRKVWHNEEWYFSVIDVIGLLTDSKNPRKYWTSMQNREKQLDTICIQLKMKAADGKNYKTDVANIEGVFRILMSVPSPKVEPLKLWLAQVGRERIEETEQPELGIKRSLEYYKAKGYTDEWIKKQGKVENGRIFSVLIKIVRYFYIPSVCAANFRRKQQFNIITIIPIKFARCRDARHRVSTRRR